MHDSMQRLQRPSFSPPCEFLPYGLYVTTDVWWFNHDLGSLTPQGVPYVQESRLRNQALRYGESSIRLMSWGRALSVEPLPFGNRSLRSKGRRGFVASFHLLDFPLSAALDNEVVEER